MSELIARSKYGHIYDDGDSFWGTRREEKFHVKTLGLDPLSKTTKLAALLHSIEAPIQVRLETVEILPTTWDRGAWQECKVDLNYRIHFVGGMGYLIVPISEDWNPYFEEPDTLISRDLFEFEDPASWEKVRGALDRMTARLQNLHRTNYRIFIEGNYDILQNTQYSPSWNPPRE